MLAERARPADAAPGIRVIADYEVVVRSHDREVLIIAEALPELCGQDGTASAAISCRSDGGCILLAEARGVVLGLADFPVEHLEQGEGKALLALVNDSGGLEAALHLQVCHWEKPS